MGPGRRRCPSPDAIGSGLRDDEVVEGSFRALRRHGDEAARDDGRGRESSEGCSVGRRAQHARRVGAEHGRVPVGREATALRLATTCLLGAFGGLASGLSFGRRLRPWNDAGDIGIFVRSERGTIGFPPLSLVTALGFLLLTLLASDFFLTLFEGIRSRSHCRGLFCLSAAKKRGIRSAHGWSGQEPVETGEPQPFQAVTFQGTR